MEWVNRENYITQVVENLNELFNESSITFPFYLADSDNKEKDNFAIIDVNYSQTEGDMASSTNGIILATVEVDYLNDSILDLLKGTQKIQNVLKDNEQLLEDNNMGFASSKNPIQVIPNAYSRNNEKIPAKTITFQLQIM